VRAGMWSDQDKLKTAHWEWSDWQDVPTVDQASGRVSK
jgi:hypothetical protein